MWQVSWEVAKLPFAIVMKWKTDAWSAGWSLGHACLGLMGLRDRGRRHQTVNEPGFAQGRGLIVVQSLSRVWRFATPWTAACQASLSFTISQSLLKLMSIESVMLSDHHILCHPFLLLPSIFPSIFFPESFPMSRLFTSGGQSIGISASVLPVNIQGWLPLGFTDLISLVSKGLSSLLQHQQRPWWENKGPGPLPPRTWRLKMTAGMYKLKALLG